MLVLSGVGDFRVPITQSYKLFHALKDAGVNTQFFAYPVSGHMMPRNTCVLASGAYHIPRIHWQMDGVATSLVGDLQITL